MRTSKPSNGRPQLPRAASGRSRSKPARRQYGPHVSVMPKMFARVPGAGRCSGGSTAGRLPGPRLDRSVGGEPRVGGEADGLVGPAPEERDPLPFEERERALGFGDRLGEQRRTGDEDARAGRSQNPPVQKNGIGM